MAWCCSPASAPPISAFWPPLPTRRPCSLPRTTPYPSPPPPSFIRNFAAQETVDTPPDPQPPIALDSSPPSLLTLSNIDKAFRGEDLSTPDHYATLGVKRGASYEEVRKAFKDKCERVLQQGSDEDLIRNKLQILKVSYDVLSSEEQRRLYDWSLLHAESLDGEYRWPYEADITQRNYGSGPPRAPEDEEGTRMVGYFFLGWFILSCILSLLLK